jgi:hypothetical protein
VYINKNRMIVGMLIACLMPSAVAAAQDEEPSGLRVQILDYQSIEGDDDFARGLSLAVRMASMSRPGLRVSERSVTLQQMRLAHECGDSFTPTVDCYARIAETMSVDIVITGVVQRSSEDPDSYEYLVLSEVFDARSGEIVGTVRSRFARADANAEIASQFSRVLGELLARIETGDAEIIAPPWNEPFSRSTSSRPARGPSLLTVSGGVFLGFAAITAAIAIGGGVHLNGLADDPTYHAYRLRVPSAVNGAALNVCNEARRGSAWTADGSVNESELAHVRDICDQAVAWEVAVPILWAGTGILAAAGGVLLILGLTDGSGSVAFTPSVGPDHAYLELSGSF